MPHSMSKQLVLSNVTLRMGDVDVLKDASLDCDLSGAVLLKGCNGVGKTSFLRMLLGLEKPESGSITIDGKSPAQARKSMGYMPQSDESLGGRLPAWTHVAAALNGEKWGLALSSRKEDAFKLLEECAATSFANRPFQNLSGGQKQRIRLAVALASNPSRLLLDEPFSGLDVTGCTELGKLLEKLSAKGCGILLSIHGASHMSEAATELHMEGGKINVRL